MSRHFFVGIFNDFNILFELLISLMIITLVIDTKWYNIIQIMNKNTGTVECTFTFFSVSKTQMHAFAIIIVHQFVRTIT